MINEYFEILEAILLKKKTSTLHLKKSLLILEWQYLKVSDTKA